MKRGIGQAISDVAKVFGALKRFFGIEKRDGAGPLIASRFGLIRFLVPSLNPLLIGFSINQGCQDC